MKWILSALLAGAALSPMAAAAQGTTTLAQPLSGTRLDISATGEATRVPDLAVISAGVTAQAATANLIIKLLGTAGIREPGVTPTSIRLWGAAQHLNTYGIEAAARVLGVDSLESAAAALGYHWQEHS